MARISAPAIAYEMAKVMVMTGEITLRFPFVRAGAFLVSSSYAVPMAAEHPGFNTHTVAAIGIMTASGLYGWFAEQKSADYYERKYSQASWLRALLDEQRDS